MADLSLKTAWRFFESGPITEYIESKSEKASQRACGKRIDGTEMMLDNTLE